MIPVNNKKVISRLSHKTLKANRTRNLIAIAAIALTTLLFTALFTIAGTIVNSYQQETFRQVGGNMHGTFKDITWEQVEKLSADPLIERCGARLMLGMPEDPPFNKSHVEVSYMDETCAKGYFCMPEYGSLPQEGTDQIACDTRILSLLGAEPRVGAKITMPYYLENEDGTKQFVNDTFTLSGWWEYDEASMSSMAIVSRSYAEQALSGFTPSRTGVGSGLWSLDVYFSSSRHIEEDMNTVLQNHGYQSDDSHAENFIKFGVNWAYLGAQFSNQADPSTMASIAALLALIIFTGYLIIYNIFQISVTNDIRFYGLLKTIGTTGRQLRRIIRRQALTLSIVGIPVGLVLGWLAGNVLSPVVMSTLTFTKAYTTANPLIFLGAALFSLITVLISCAKPGKMAAKVSPIEALRYTEGSRGKTRKGKSGGKVKNMALANMGRSKKRTVLVVLSLSLAVVLLEITCTFAHGFDMDKYLRTWVVSDFILGDARYFQSSELFSSETAVPQEAIDMVNAQGGITKAGCIYGQSRSAQEFISEDRFRLNNSAWHDEDTLNQWLAAKEHLPDGRVPDHVQLYGMDKFPLDQLTVINGDISDLYNPAKNAIAAVYHTDDYGNTEEETNWAKPGDQMVVRYVDEWKYYDIRTGEVLPLEKIESGYLGSRAAKYHDVTYTVAACVTMRNSMSYRYSGNDEFVLNADVFKRDSGTSDVMTYLFNTTEESNASMENYLKNYTESTNPTLNYESKQSYVSEFDGFRNMFLLMGGALSFIVGLVGILNFLNAVLTSILTRRREFAMLQSIGMTGKQLKSMLIWEGVLYALIASAVSLGLSLGAGPLLGKIMNSMFWFFTYRFTILPVLIVMPIFILLGIFLPLISYHFTARQTIVERLRESE